MEEINGESLKICKQRVIKAGGRKKDPNPENSVGGPEVSSPCTKGGFLQCTHCEC